MSIRENVSRFPFWFATSGSLREPRANCQRGSGLAIQHSTHEQRSPCLPAIVAFLRSIHLTEQDRFNPHQHEPTRVDPFQSFQTFNRFASFNAFRRFKVQEFKENFRVSRILETTKALS